MKKFISKNGVTSESQSLSGGNPNSEQASRPVLGKRSVLKDLGATGALLLPASEMLMSKAQAQEMRQKKHDDSGGKFKQGAMPQFLVHKKGTAHKPHAAYGGHQLLEPISQ